MRRKSKLDTKFLTVLALAGPATVLAPIVVAPAHAAVPVAAAHADGVIKQRSDYGFDETIARLKADIAEGAALVFGRLAIRRAGSVGVVAFGGAQPITLPPRGSKPGIVALRRLLAEGVSADGSHHADGLAEALRRVARLATQAGRRAVGPK